MLGLLYVHRFQRGDWSCADSMVCPARWRFHGRDYSMGLPYILRNVFRRYDFADYISCFVLMFSKPIWTTRASSRNKTLRPFSLLLVL